MTARPKYQSVTYVWPSQWKWFVDAVLDLNREAKTNWSIPILN